MARCADLPPELIALIISFHRGPKSSLCRYSLVCHAWLAPSQRRLFHTFKWFNLGKNLVPFHDFLLGAPHLGAYVQDFHAVGPFIFGYDAEEASDFVADATDRENVENLFSLLPNVITINAQFLASSPFLFTNNLLRRCTRLRKFTVACPLRITDDVSPTVVFPSLKDTTVKSLVIQALGMPSAIDSPLDSDAKVCSVEHLTLESTHNLSVWFPYFRGILPAWSELTILCDAKGISKWSDLLPANDLSHLRRLHVSVSVRIVLGNMVSEFPHDDASPLAPSLSHLLLTTKVIYLLKREDLSIEYDITTEVIVSMVEWYICTLTPLSRNKESTLKELSLTVMALDEPTVAAAWAKVDDILSTSAFDKLKHVHFFDEQKEPITTWSDPDTVPLLNQVLSKLSRAGKLAV